MDDQVKWAAEEYVKLQRLDIKRLNKQLEAAEKVLKAHAAANPELEVIEANGDRIAVKRGTWTGLDQPAVTVFLGKDLAQFQKTSPTISLALEPTAAAAKTAP